MWGADRGKPPGQGADLFLGVVFTRHDQSGDLHMATARGQGDGALHRREVAAQSTVPVLRKALQVDIHPIHQRQQLQPRFLLNGTVGHQHIEQPGFMHQRGAVPHILIAHQRLVVGVGHTNIAPVDQAAGLLHQSFRRAGTGGEFLPRPGNLNVLAKGAAQIAAKTAHRQHHAAGVEPAQRLFLNGVQGQRGQLAVVQGDDPSAPVGSGPAQSRLPLLQVTVVKAQRASGAHR